MTLPPNHSSFIPADKFDIDAVARAKAAGYPAIASALPGLLEWLQDMNWPVAQPVLELLASVGAPVVPHVVEALRGDHAIWKYWLLSELALQFDAPARQGLIDECQRIVNHPTAREREEEVHLVARDVLILHVHKMNTDDIIGTWAKPETAGEFSVMITAFYLHRSGRAVRGYFVYKPFTNLDTELYLGSWKSEEGKIVVRVAQQPIPCILTCIPPDQMIVNYKNHERVYKKLTEAEASLKIFNLEGDPDAVIQRYLETGEFP